MTRFQQPSFPRLLSSLQSVLAILSLRADQLVPRKSFVVLLSPANLGCCWRSEFLDPRLFKSPRRAKPRNPAPSKELQVAPAAAADAGTESHLNPASSSSSCTTSSQRHIAPSTKHHTFLGLRTSVRFLLRLGVRQCAQRFDVSYRPVPLHCYTRPWCCARHSTQPRHGTKLAPLHPELATPSSREQASV